MKTNMKTKIGVGIGFLIILTLGFLMLTQNISGQKKGNPTKSDNNKPKVDIKVNKQVDKNGNITSYDSTYSWSWSSDGSIPEDIDSIFKSFHNENFNFSIFNDSLFFSMPLGFNPSVLNDSIGNHEFYKDFFDEDFGNIEKFFNQHNQLIEKYFRHDPYLKIPDNSKVNPPAEKNDNKIAPKQNNKIKTEKISGTNAGVII